MAALGWGFHDGTLAVDLYAWPCRSHFAGSGVFLKVGMPCVRSSSAPSVGRTFAQFRGSVDVALPDLSAGRDEFDTIAVGIVDVRLWVMPCRRGGRAHALGLQVSQVLQPRLAIGMVMAMWFTAHGMPNIDQFSGGFGKSRLLHQASW
jgi:hypothetical protein